MSIECTTSANSTVTCLYSAGCPAPIGDPHSLQNLAVALTSVPHDPHESPVVVISREAPLAHIDMVSPLTKLVCPDHAVGRRAPLTRYLKIYER